MANRFSISKLYVYYNETEPKSDDAGAKNQ